MKLAIPLLLLCVSACTADVRHLPDNYKPPIPAKSQQHDEKKLIATRDRANEETKNTIPGAAGFPGGFGSFPNGIVPNGFNPNNAAANFGFPGQQYQAFPPNFAAFPPFQQPNYQPPFYPQQGFQPNFPQQLFAPDFQQGFGLGSNVPQQIPPGFQQGFGFSPNAPQLPFNGQFNFPQQFDTKTNLKSASETKYSPKGGYLYDKP